MSNKKAGHRMSEAEAAKLADEFERLGPADFDTPRPGPGRPSLLGGTGTSPRRGIRLPESLDALYRARAEQEGKSVSAIMRAVLTRYAPRL